MKIYKTTGIALLSVLVSISCGNDDEATSDDLAPIDDEVVLDLRTELYVTNNTDGDITIYDLSEQPAEARTLNTLSNNSEGIYYNASQDEVIQASRSLLQLNTYGNVSAAIDGGALTVSGSSGAVLESPRDIAVSGSTYVVSDNGDVDGDEDTDDGRFYIFTKEENGFSLRNTLTVDFAVWGIEFVGNDLVAVVDKTSEIAIFNNFLSQNTDDDDASPSQRIVIEGIIRTHGLSYDGTTMILTDIGDAAVDTDGAFHIIPNFAGIIGDIADGGTLAVAGFQTRIAGDETFLGNPVAAAYDAASNTVFIAERANGGGRVLAFIDADAGGNIAPDINNSLQGASSLYLYAE